MHFAIRTVKRSSSIICAANVYYRQKECLAISTGKYLVFYNIVNGKLEKEGELQLGTYVISIIPLDSKKYVLISSDNQYVILSDQKVIKSGRISKERLWKKENKIKKCLYMDGKVVILFNSNKLCIMYIAHNRVKIDENIKDLLAYSVYDIIIHNNEIITLLGDIEGKTYIHYYTFRENKKGIMFKDRKIMSGAYRILAAHNKLYVFRNGVVTVIDGDNHVDMQFANPSLLNGIEYMSGVLLTMEDRELIYLSEKVNILYRFNDVIDDIVMIKGYILGLSYYGSSILFRIDDAVVVSDTIVNISHPRNLQFRENLHFISGINFNNLLCEICYKIPVISKTYLRFPERVKKVWHYNDYLIVSFLDKGLIMKNKTIWEKIDEIQNFRGFEKYCVFNTKKHIYKLTNFLVAKETKNIVLSDIDEHHVVVYTESKEISIYDIENLLMSNSILFNLEVCLIKWLYNDILVSTFDNKVYIMNRELILTKAFNFDSLKSAEYIKSTCLVVCTLASKIYVLDLATSRSSYLFEMEYIVSLEKYDTGLLIAGKNVVFITENLSCYGIELENVTSMHFSGILLFSCKNTIYRAIFGRYPVFKVKTKQIKGEGLCFLRNKKSYYLGYRQGCSSMLTKNKNRQEYKVEMPNEIIRSIKKVKHFLVIATNYKNYDGNNVSKLILFDNLTKTYEITKHGVLFSVDVYKDYIATSHGFFLTVYKIHNKVIVELAKIPCPIFPWKIKFNSFSLIVCDVFRSFAIYSFDTTTNSIIEDCRCFEKFVADESIKIDNEYLVSDEIGNLFSCTKYDINDDIIRHGSFNYQESIICIEKGSLNIKKDQNTYYFSTSSGSIGIMKKYENNQILDQIKCITYLIGKKLPFNYAEATSYETEEGVKNSVAFIDCDVLVHYKQYETEIKKMYTNYNEIESWIKELISIH